MSQSPTIYQFEIALSHVDRGIYETLSVRVARQPSETPDFLLTRLLAYCLEYQEGIGFGKGFTEPGEPALAVRDLTGALTVWIDIGAPDPARLHKASLTVPRVVLYTHKEPRTLLPQLAAARIHRAALGSRCRSRMRTCTSPSAARCSPDRFNATSWREGSDGARLTSLP